MVGPVGVDGHVDIGTCATGSCRNGRPGVFGDIDHRGLRLVICGGDLNRCARQEDNVVVFAEPVQTVVARA